MDSVPRLAVDHAPLLAWRPSLRGVLLAAVGFGFLLSTQLLFQPFVWRNWPLDEILLGWWEAAREGFVVATMIALGLWAAATLPIRRGIARGAWLGVGIAGGAFVGQWVVPAVVSGDAAATLGTALPAALRWSLLAASVVGIFALRRQIDSANAAIGAAELQRVSTARLAAQVRLQVLRSQIEPHFLFNTLATVRRLHQTEPAEGAQLLAHFLAYLQLSLPSRPDDGGSLDDEIRLARAYLGVVGVRMSGRLAVIFDVPPSLEHCEFPPLVLTTLIENAVKHGLAPAADGGKLRITARAVGDGLEVEVADTGIGFSGQGGGSGIGLSNTRARLQALFGAGGRLVLAANEPTGVRATVRIPLRGRVAVP